MRLSLKQGVELIELFGQVITTDTNVGGRVDECAITSISSLSVLRFVVLFSALLASIRARQPDCGCHA